MMKHGVGVAGAVLAGAMVMGAGGCGVVQPVPMLPANAFVANQPIIGPGSGEAIDNPGPLVYDAQHRPQRQVPEQAHISEVVRESVRTPQEQALATTRNATDFPPPAPFVVPHPATQPAIAGQRGQGAGQWQWVGSVLAVVNSEPIYAHKVVNTLDRALAAEARAGTEEHFKAVAEDLVFKQIREFIDNDLEYAAAQHSLEKQDEQLAKVLTGEWRKDQVRKAGGSEAMARRRAADEGEDFEELVQQRFRLIMTQLYYQRKIIPLIQISAQDMREYYQGNLRKYQQPAAAKFRVIWIGSEKTGGRDAALEKARRQVYEPARKGADFADLASRINDDPGLMHSRGVVGDEKGWMEKGAYASEEVERAVWGLKPGEVTEPIIAQDRGADGVFVAKLEEIQPGQSEPFESQKVQDDIRETLRREQFAKLREVHRRKLVQEAVIDENPNMRQAAMEMVMQRYRVWVASR